jgi:deazaflavin-dependent oxidoreductase (nitroreductase family)
MTFDNPRGTHGARQPSANPLMRFGNTMNIRRIRSKGGRGVMGMNVLVLTTVGAKTGQERSSPVAWFPGDDGDSWIISASAAGGPHNPAWYYNLAAHPDKARIELDGQSIDVTAEQLHGAEREQAWQKIVTAAPRFGKYTTTTDRVIPVIRLRRRVV